MKCDGTRAETRFRLSVKRTSPFKSAGSSAQSTTGSRGVRISGSNAGYNMFRGSVKSTGYTLLSPVSSFTSPPVRHRVPSHFNWPLPTYKTRRRYNPEENNMQLFQVARGFSFSRYTRTVTDSNLCLPHYRHYVSNGEFDGDTHQSSECVY